MKKIIIGIIGILSLFYIVSCSSTEDTSPGNTSPEDNFLKGPPPENFRRTQCLKTTSMDLAWDATSGATSYKLYRNSVTITNTDATTYTDTGLTPGTEYTYKVQSCSTNGCSTNAILKETTLRDDSFGSIIEVERTPADLDGYDERSREIFSHYGGNTFLVAKYLKPGGSGDGSSFDKASGNLRTVLSGITDAAANKVYVVIVTGGTYNLDGSTANIAMKSHVAIVGGLDRCLDPSKSPTVLHGGGVQSVFINNGNSLNNTALLYDVSVVKGNRVDSSGKGGGGMYNNNVSPSLVRVIFSENYSAFDGGAMHNVGGSPRLTKVSFFSNEGGNYGGAMANHDSSPILEEVIFLENKSPNLYGGAVYNKGGSPSFNKVVFSNNTGEYGGAVYNTGSSASYVDVTFSGNTATKEWGGAMFNGSYTGTLINVTFSGNTAKTLGGAMYNHESSPTLIGTTFTKNTASERGGAMYNNNTGKPGPLIINGIFWGNTATGTGPQFQLHNDGSGQENLGIYNSIVEGGTGTLTSGTSYTSVNQGGFVSGGGSAPVVISFANSRADNPQLGGLVNSGFVLTHAIPSTSPAVNQGLYVRRKDNTFYYSVNNTAWYNTPALIGQAVTPPADAVDLTATDATGYARTDRPDLGAYEARN